MNITSNSPLRTQNFKAGGAKPKSEDMVERIVDGTYLSANYAASGLSGGISGTSAWLTTGLKEVGQTTGSALTNIVKTEHYGPVLKTVACTGALVAGVGTGLIGIPCALLAGIYSGARQVDSNEPRQFNIKEATHGAFSGVQDTARDAGKDCRRGLEELGNYQLKPGEKPLEIPLVKLGKTVLMTSAAGAAGVGVGLATAATGAVSESARELTEAVKDPRLDVSDKLFAGGTALIAGATHGVVFGASSGLNILGEGASTTWETESVREGAQKILQESRNAMAAAINPQAALLEKKS